MYLPDLPFHPDVCQDLVLSIGSIANPMFLSRRGEYAAVVTLPIGIPFSKTGHHSSLVPFMGSAPKFNADELALDTYLFNSFECLLADEI